jgi:hypothetical protein
MSGTSTLMLDPVAWDLVTDDLGNIATVAAPYALAQTVSNALRTWLGEVYYNTAIGVPYRQTIFNGPNSLPVVNALLQAQAMTVNGVVAAAVALDTITDRVLTGTVYVTDQDGVVSSAEFST